METVKISTLKKDMKIWVEDYSLIIPIEKVFKNMEEFKNKELYTTIERYATFNAKEILEQAIEDECCNEMYEDWAEIIKESIDEKDIKEIQLILNRILARNPEQNIAYEIDKLIEIDV